MKEDDLEQENDDDVSDLDSDENVDDQNEEGDFEGFEEENFDESDFHLSEEEDPLAKLKAIKEAKRMGNLRNQEKAGKDVSN